MELADRVVVMSNGRIEQVGSADDIYDAPASPFVFSFIGASNALPVVVAGGQVIHEGSRLDLPTVAERDGEARLYLRPHDLDLVEAAPGAIAGTVAAIRRTSGHRLVELEVGAARARLEVEIPAERPVAVGERISVRPRRWRIYRDDGRRAPAAA